VSIVRLFADSVARLHKLILLVHSRHKTFVLYRISVIGPPDIGMSEGLKVCCHTFFPDLRLGRLNSCADDLTIYTVSQKSFHL